MKKITVLIGSVRKGRNTERLAEAFCSGSRQENEVRIISVSQYHVHPCNGCNACRTREEHTCVQKDDMAAIYEILADTDILVLASPVYFYGLSAQLKAIIDRLHSPQRKAFHITQLGLLLVAADTIPTVFDAISVQYQSALDYFGLGSIGTVCVRGVEERGAIFGNAALAEAEALGRSLSGTI